MIEYKTPLRGAAERLRATTKQYPKLTTFKIRKIISGIIKRVSSNACPELLLKPCFLRVIIPPLTQSLPPASI